jgi:hypothetical protein
MRLTWQRQVQHLMLRRRQLHLQLMHCSLRSTALQVQQAALLAWRKWKGPC